MDESGVQNFEEQQYAQYSAGMSRAQQVRAKVLAANPKITIDKLAPQIFDWVLDLIDSDDPEKKKLFGKGQVQIWYYTNSKTFSKISCHVEDFSLAYNNFTAAQMKTLFEAVKELFDDEEGYTANISSEFLSATLYIVLSPNSTNKLRKFSNPTK